MLWVFFTGDTIRIFIQPKLIIWVLLHLKINLLGNIIQKLFFVVKLFLNIISTHNTDYYSYWHWTKIFSTNPRKIEIRFTGVFHKSSILQTSSSLLSSLSSSFSSLPKKNFRAATKIYNSNGFLQNIFFHMNEVQCTIK